MNLKKYCKNKIKKFKYFCIKKKCAFALLISDKLIQKITNHFASHLKDDANSTDESLELIKKVFQLEDTSRDV